MCVSVIARVSTTDSRRFTTDSRRFTTGSHTYTPTSSHTTAYNLQVAEEATTLLTVEKQARKFAEERARASRERAREEAVRYV
jgi:hypothetical protein